MATRPPRLWVSLASCSKFCHSLWNSSRCSFIFASPFGVLELIDCHGQPPTHGMEPHSNVRLPLASMSFQVLLNVDCCVASCCSVTRITWQSDGACCPSGEVLSQQYSMMVRLWFRIEGFDCGTLISPVLPNPLVLRSVLPRLSTSLSCTSEHCSTISCAIQSPGFTWKSNFPWLKRSTMISPV